MVTYINDFGLVKAEMHTCWSRRHAIGLGDGRNIAHLIMEKTCYYFGYALNIAYIGSEHIHL